MLAERNSLAAIHRVKGIKEENRSGLAPQSCNHAEDIETLLLANQHLTRVQLDAMWTYVGHKGKSNIRGAQSRYLLARHRYRY